MVWVTLHSKGLHGSKQLEACSKLEANIPPTLASQLALEVKNPPANSGDIRGSGLIPGQEDPLEEGMATHSSILAWRIPWTEEPGGLQSMRPQRVRHD